MNENENKVVTKVENLSECSVKITVQVTAEEFAIALDKAFDKVVKEVKVDGFRPGKMPKSMFISRFGWNVLYQDALDFVLEASYPQAIEEADVYPVAQPKIDLDIEKLEHDKGFEYTIIVDVIPPVHLGEYKGLKIKTLSRRVTKKNITEQIEKTLADKVENVIKDGPAEKGDTLVIDFTGYVDGVAFEGGNAENYELELGSNSFIPGFEDQLIGTMPEQELDVNVTFPANYHESLASKDATFKVKVHEIKGKVYPELTVDLVKELNVEGVTTVEQYMEYVKKTLTEQKEEAYKKDLENKVVDAACKNAKCDIPQSLIDQEVERRVQDLEKQASQYNMPVETLLQYIGCASIDAYKKIATEQAKKSIKEELVLSEIVKVEKLEATQEEITTEYEKLAQIKDEDDEEEKAKKLKNIMQRYQISQIAYHINIRKAVEFLISNAIYK